MDFDFCLGSFSDIFYSLSVFPYDMFDVGAFNCNCFCCVVMFGVWYGYLSCRVLYFGWFCGWFIGCGVGSGFCGWSSGCGVGSMGGGWVFCHSVYCIYNGS